MPDIAPEISSLRQKTHGKQQSLSCGCHNVKDCFLRALREHDVLDELGESPKGIDRKSMESDRGFLNYVTQACLAMVPCLKGVHLTIDGWRPDHNDQGWKRRRQEIEALRRNGDLDDYDHRLSPVYVKPVPRYRGDLRALEKLTEAPNPPKRKIRAKEIIHVERGFGDASGKGFGSTVTVNEIILW
jgi:hypothetical protein